jgi:uncharacterized repeat protein (TIGR01451 family)
VPNCKIAAKPFGNSPERYTRQPLCADYYIKVCPLLLVEGPPGREKVNRIFFVAFAAYMIVAVSYAEAALPVVLKLSGAVVTKAADGSEKATPLSETFVKPGETIRYELVASNEGDSPIHNLIPAEQFSPNTAYEPGSAMPATAGVQFSLDNLPVRDSHKTWSAKPMVTVHTPNGDVTKPADPATYTAIRWTSGVSLAPSETAKYSYEVLVK